MHLSSLTCWKTVVRETYSNGTVVCTRWLVLQSRENIEWLWFWWLKNRRDTVWNDRRKTRLKNPDIRISRVISLLFCETGDNTTYLNYLRILLRIMCLKWLYEVRVPWTLYSKLLKSFPWDKVNHFTKARTLSCSSPNSQCLVHGRH